MNLLKVTLPKHAHVLLLEDSEMRIEWFRKRIPNLTVVSSVEEFIAYFDKKPQCDFIFYDHDLGDGKGTGTEAAKWIHDHFGGGSKWAVIHSWNRAGAIRMREYMPNTPHIPFGDFDVEVE
jgi:hypothetical protein